MRIGLISDVHGNVYGLQTALNGLKKERVDRIICAGDLTGYYPFVNETIDLIRQEDISCILGNHDAILTGKLPVEDKVLKQYNLDYARSVILPENLKWLKHLSSSLQIDIAGIHVSVYHGSPWSPLTAYIYPDFEHFERFREIPSKYVVLGHTHWPFARKVGETLVINPGSCGQPRDYQPGACYAVLSIDIGQVYFHRGSYDLESFAQLLEKYGIDEPLISIQFRTKENGNALFER